MISKLSKYLSVAVAMGAACYGIYRLVKDAKDGTNTDNADHNETGRTGRSSRVADAGEEKRHKKPHKFYTCKRCFEKTDQPVKYNGRIVCPSCAQIVGAEIAKGYKHGPGFGRLSNRLCTRCRVDLQQLEPWQIHRIGDAEYCDVCATKIPPQHQHPRQVYNAVVRTMSEFSNALPAISHYENHGKFYIRMYSNPAISTIYVDIDEELTLEFGYWHRHYNYDDGAQYHAFYDDLCKIISNQACSAAAFDEGAPKDPDDPEDTDLIWRASSLLDASVLPEDDDKAIAVLRKRFGDAAIVRCDFWDDSKSRLFRMVGEMCDIAGDPVFDSVLSDYRDCVLDYRLMRCNQPNRGIVSHREALRHAMKGIVDALNREIKCAWKFNIHQAVARQISPSEWLAEPPKKVQLNAPLYIDTDDRIAYWRAFLEPPYSNCVKIREKCGNHPAKYRDATVEDFRRVNEALFPKGTDDLEIYTWSTDWSNYFDDGHEWWGTGCWSIYDPRMGRYIVILASATD